ncbi:MAG: hypothetical protein HY550_02075 [Elusimicrobia bacterium]|nr:hypothetical protein [Elusimicrobiota bacterium]
MDEEQIEPAPQRGLAEFIRRMASLYMRERALHVAYHWLFRLLHWILAAGILVLVYSGAGIHSIARPEWSLTGRYPEFFGEGRIFLWHLIAAVFFLPAAVVASVLFFSRIRNIPGWSSRRFASIALLAGSLLSCISAFGLVYTGVPSWLYQASRLAHFTAGLIFAPLGFLMHLYLALTKHRALLIPTFTPFRQPRWKTMPVYLGALGVSFLVVTQLPLRKDDSRELSAKKIRNVPQNWAAVKNLDWDRGEALEFTLVNGSGFNKGSSEVALAALYDDTDIYFKITWTDPREERDYWPWVKTGDGWERLAAQPKDETVYYEDKFSLLFPKERNKMFETYGCAVKCHADPKYRYGYSAADKLIDLWHWKASRTDPAGYAEDQYILGQDLGRKDVGRFPDPDEGGGFIVNLSADGKTPLYLPAGKGAEVPGAILRSKAAPYTKEAGVRLPEGTRIPGLVIAPMKGDRGDVKCSSQYRNGKWTLFLRRKLNTGSKYDVAFVPGRSHPFAAAAFDHAAKRHAYNHQVYQLVLESAPPAAQGSGTERAVPD